MATRRGDTLIFQTPPVIAAHAAVGGKKEGEGPLAAGFDVLSADNRFGQPGWEAAETQLQLRAARLCLKKAQITEKEVSLALAGDLQAQCTASNYAMRALGIPYAGLFGACSTMAEALGLGAALCSAGLADGLLAMTSSHFCAAERQFRTPLSYGAVRTPTAQWTATAAGCCLLHPAGQGVGIAAATFGRVQDYQVRDINNMGAAMAPAAASTLLHYFADTSTEPQDFDCIYTGDLGQVGSQLLRELLAAEGQAGQVDEQLPDDADGSAHAERPEIIHCGPPFCGERSSTRCATAGILSFCKKVVWLMSAPVATNSTRFWLPRRRRGRMCPQSTAL